MNQQEQKIKNLINKNMKQKPIRKSDKTKIGSNENKSAINEANLSIREMKSADKYNLFKIVSEFRRDYYINIYKKSFRNWFTYLITGVLLAVTLKFINTQMTGICLPPLIVTVYILWKVNRFKKMNRYLNVNDMELLNLNETIYYKFKTTEQRKINQGVLLAFLKENKKLEELNIDDIDLSDLDTDSSSSGIENKINEKNKKLVAYLVYGKQRDELETVCIKELCVSKEFRRRKIASVFLKKTCLNIFKPLGYKRVTFQLSSFDIEAEYAYKKNTNLINKIYSWIAYNFIPGVQDERTVYAFNINQLNNF